MLSGHSGWSFWKASAMAERSASTQTVILAVGSCATVGKPYWLPVEEPADSVGPLVGVPEPAGVPGQRSQSDCWWTDCSSSPLRQVRCRLRLRTLPSTCGAHFVDAKTCRCSCSDSFDFFDHSRRHFEVNHTCDVLAIEASKARHLDDFNGQGQWPGVTSITGCSTRRPSPTGSSARSRARRSRTPSAWSSTARRASTTGLAPAHVAERYQPIPARGASGPVSGPP